MVKSHVIMGLDHTTVNRKLGREQSAELWRSSVAKRHNLNAGSNPMCPGTLLVIQHNSGMFLKGCFRASAETDWQIRV